MSQSIFCSCFVIPILFPLFLPTCLWVSNTEAQSTHLDTSSNHGVSCIPDQASTHIIQAHVRYVIDGDTLVLTSGERVRIIGINAPELDRKNKQAQPYAEESRDFLSSLLPGSDSEITLIAGTEQIDQYGRSLYHLVTPDNRNLAFEMLASGMAAQAAVTPNTRCADDYASAEKIARKKRLGLWNKTNAWTVSGNKIPGRATGFYIVTDLVKRVSVVNSQTDAATGDTSKTSWLRLGNGLLINFRHAASFNSTALKGKLIEVRGWIYRYRNKPALNLQHRANLAIIE